MNEDARVPRWLDDLRATLNTAAELSARGREAFDTDPAVSLAFEALSNRVGDLAKRLLAADAERFTDPIWRQAARQRDFVVHHYDRVDADLLWRTVTESFPKLAYAVGEAFDPITVRRSA
ncbi:HepT-like ribonuclease domain-containing protein [Microbacterium sp.]|uniref:HepT-like ribonuclease domain-containing protein n=1 Tax=Microbacterium sp. TaxID=51671 RepID=UPI003F98D8F7